MAKENHKLLEDKKSSSESEHEGKSIASKSFEKDEIRNLKDENNMLRTQIRMLNESASKEFYFQKHDYLNKNQEISNLKRQIQTLKTQNEIEKTNTERFETQIKELKVINGDYQKQIETQNQQNYYLTTENSQLKDKFFKMSEGKKFNSQQVDNFSEKIYHNKKTEITNQYKEDKLLAQKGLIKSKVS